MKCKVKGHMTAMCTAEKKKLRPIWVGYGVEGRGFFHVSIPEDLMKKPMANTAKICVEKGNFSTEELMEELRELVDDNWDWQVRKLSTTDFMVVFPSSELLRMASRGGGLVLPITAYRAVVSEVSGDPLAAESLERVWLKLSGVPDPLREEAALMSCTLELGTPLEVDVASLGNPSAPIRMCFGCRKPVQVKPSFTVFINLQGYLVTVEREGEESDLGPLPPPPPLPPRSKEDKDEDDAAAEDSSEGEDDDYGRKRRRKSRSGSVGKGGGGTAGEGKSHEQGAPKDSVLHQLELSPLPPAPCEADARDTLELPKSMFSQYGSNLTPEGNVFKTLGAIVQAAKAPAQSVVTSEAPGGSIFSDSGLLSPRETEPGSPSVVITVSSSQDDGDSARAREWRSKKNHDRPAKGAVPARSEPLAPPSSGPEHPAPSGALALGDFLTAPAIPGLGAPVARGLRSKAAPVEIVRKSARRAGDSEEPVSVRAARVTAEKFASTTKATPHAKKLQKGNPPDPIFSILQDLPDAHLLSVTSDSCVVFPSVAGEASEVLSIIRANELAQAALASTRDRVARELSEAKKAEATKELVESGKQGTTSCPEGGSRRCRRYRRGSSALRPLNQDPHLRPRHLPRGGQNRSLRRGGDLLPAKHGLTEWLSDEVALLQHSGLRSCGAPNPDQKPAPHAPDRHCLSAGNHQARIHGCGASKSGSGREILLVLAARLWSLGRHPGGSSGQCLRCGKH